MAENPPTVAWGIIARVEAGDSPYRPSKNCIWLRDRFRTALEAARDGQTPR